MLPSRGWASSHSTATASSSGKSQAVISQLARGSCRSAASTGLVSSGSWSARSPGCAGGHRGRNGAPSPVRQVGQQVEGEVARHLDGYRFDLASKELYEFIWNDYCDWYIELSKPVIYSDEASVEQKRAARQTLIRVLETWLRLLHPIMPFITEELWQKVAPLAGKQGETIMLQPYPMPETDRIDQAAMAELNWVKAFIMGVRQIRSEMDIKPGKLLPVLLQNGSAQDRQRMEANRSFLMSLARLESITWLETGEHAPESAPALVGDASLLIPLAGLIDKQAELERLDKNMSKLQGEIKRLTGKLGNANFVDKAPEAVVEKEREKLVEVETALRSLQAQADKIRAL